MSSSKQGAGSTLSPAASGTATGGGRRQQAAPSHSSKYLVSHKTLPPHSHGGQRQAVRAATERHGYPVRRLQAARAQRGDEAAYQRGAAR